MLNVYRKNVDHVIKKMMIFFGNACKNVNQPFEKNMEQVFKKY